MQLPSWLINATGAQQFANNPLNGFQPTLGDAAQGIGHSMMEHYRRGITPSGSQAPGVPGGFNPMLGLLGGQLMSPLGLAGGQLFKPQASPEAPPEAAQPELQQGVNVAPFQSKFQLPPLDLSTVAGLFK